MDNTKDQEKKNKKTAWILIVVAVALIVSPLIMRAGSEFGGTDDQGGEAIEEIQGGSYEPWATSPMAEALGGEIPGEMETLLFCVQTGIGVGIFAFLGGRFYERKLYADEHGISQKEASERRKKKA